MVVNDFFSLNGVTRCTAFLMLAHCLITDENDLSGDSGPDRRGVLHLTSVNRNANVAHLNVRRRQVALATLADLEDTVTDSGESLA